MRALGALGTQAGQIDTLVLGCTHYAFAMNDLVHLVGPQVRILETGEPVARRARQLLQETQRLRSSPQAGRLTLQSSGDLPTLQAAAQRWLDGPQVA